MAAAHLHTVIAWGVLDFVVIAGLGSLVRDNNLCTKFLRTVDEFIFAGRGRNVIDFQVCVLSIARKHVLDERCLPCKQGKGQA